MVVIGFDEIFVELSRKEGDVEFNFVLSFGEVENFL